MTAVKFDIISNLPMEVATEILMNLTPEDLGNAEKCCRKWKYFTYCSYFWRRKSEQDYWFAELEYSKSECYLNYVENFCNHWEGHYNYNRDLEHNWKHGICKKINVNHFLDIEELVYMNDDILIVACSYQICVINTSNGMTEKAFSTKRLLDWAFDNSENLLTALSYTHEENDGQHLTINVWNLQTNQVILNFQINFGIEIVYTRIHKHLIAFFTYDDELQVFNSKEKEIQFRRQETEAIWFGGHTMAMCSSDDSVVIINQNLTRPMPLICCDEMVIDNIQIEKDFLFITCGRYEIIENTSVRSEVSLCVWDFNILAKLFTIKNGRLADLTFINRNTLICLKCNKEESWFECMSFPEPVTQKRIANLGQGPLKYIYTSNNRFILIKVGDDTSWKLWCPTKKKCIRNFELTKNLKNFEESTIYFKYRFRDIETLIISNKNLAYVERINGEDSLHIWDFGPNIKK